MTELTNMLLIFGDPWLTLALLALAIVLLEAERWWTRWQRRRGRRIGASAYIVDALAIASAVLATASAIALLVRGIIAVVLLTGELLDWTITQARAYSGLLVAIVAGIALATAGVTLARSWLRRPRAPAERLSHLRLSEHMMAKTSADDGDADTSSIPLLLPQLPEQPATAIVLAPRLDQPASAISQIVPLAGLSPSVHAPAVSTTSTPPIIMPQTDEPIEALTSLSVLQHNRRPYTPSAPPPQSFLINAPEAPKRRPQMRLALAALALIGLSLGGFVFRQQVAGLLLALRPTTSEVTAAALSVPTPTSAPTVPTAPRLIARHVKSDVLNLRAHPGTDQPVIAKLVRGASVLLLDETVKVAGRTWVRVRAGEQEGWVSQDLLE
jgi:hypothetical protein